MVVVNAKKSMETIKISDLVIFKDQSNNMIDNSLMGGRVVMVTDTIVFLERTGRGICSYKREDMRLLKPEDVKESGIEII